MQRREPGGRRVRAKCPHRACAVRLADDIDGFRCRCHGSEFASDGTVQEGPADRDLTWLAVEVTSDGKLRVDPSREVPKGTYAPV
ncbi:MAG: Rieske 2Fe-2S domain-containing protein [Myxococcota bacterium]